MKKSILMLAMLASAATSFAQQKMYVCEGFNYTVVEAKNAEDLALTANDITIGGTKIALSDIDSITFSEPQFPEVKIVYNGNTASVVIPSNVKGVTSSVSGADVTLTSSTTTDEYLYTISGTSTNGSLTINGEYKLTLKLAGVNLATTSAKAPVNINCGKRIGVILQEGTTNVITDSEKNAAKGAFYVAGHPEFEGAGTLNVTGKAKHAIAAGEYLQLKKTTGAINILGAVSDGIHCGKGKEKNENNYFQMNGGTVTISNAGSDCIDCDDYGCAVIKGGKLTLNVSQQDGTGLKADSLFTMTGGEIIANVSGAVSEGIRCSYKAYFNGGSIKADVKGNGARAIRAKKTTKTTDTVLNGGYIYWNDANADIAVSGGTYTADNTKCYGIKADTEFKQTAGTILITVTNKDAAAYNFKANTSTGGTLTVK